MNTCSAHVKANSVDHKGFLEFARLTPKDLHLSISTENFLGTRLLSPVSLPILRKLAMSRKRRAALNARRRRAVQKAISSNRTSYVIESRYD